MVPLSSPAFCAECGSPLPAEAKFCPQCGTRAAPPPAPEPAGPEARSAVPPVPAELRDKYASAQAELRGERRQVAVLFADVKGYTSLSESLDPEEVSFFISGLLRELGEVVYEYEGHVDKFIGDAIMALFGAPIAHENDPERAVLAGLEMLDVVRRHNEREEFEIALRVGINLGEVVAGHVGRSDRSHYTVMGDTVNVASRLEGAAEPGTVLVSHGIYERIADRYETEEMPPLTLKGKSEPIRSYRVRGYRGATGQRKAPIAFVGRDEEMAAAVAWIGSIVSGGAGTLLVEAEAGAGKTRLVAEALAGAGHRTTSLEITFHPVRRPGAAAAAAQLFHDLVPGSGADEQRAALELLGEDADEHRSGVLGLAMEANPDAGLEPPPETDPETARRSRWFALHALLARLARDRPVILVVEDVQWADAGSLELFDFLLPTLPERVGAILTGRPPIELDGVPDAARRIRLRPLGEADARAILGPHWYEMSSKARTDLLRRSQGNPLFLQELVHAVEAGGDDATRLPGSLEAIIRSRIDRLSPPLQSLLQMAAVLGTRFPGELLERIWSLDSHAIPYEVGIVALEKEGFIEKGSEGERRFRHALTQEVAYRGLLHRVRKVLHESAARIGEDVLAGRIESEAPFFAHHYWEAGLVDRAAPHLWRAGKAAAERFDLATAEKFLRRAAEAFEAHPDSLDDPETRADFCETIGFVLLQRGALDDAEAWFNRLEELGQEFGRPRWRVQGTEYRGRIAWYRGQLDDAATLFEEGLEALPEEAGRLAADLHNGLGIVWLYRGDPDEAARHHRRALGIREELGDLQGRAKSHLNLGNVSIELAEDVDGAHHHYDRARALAEEVGDRQLRATALANLGRIEMERGRWNEAIDRFREARERAAEIGWTYGRYLCLQNQAYCETWLGHIGKAVRRLEACRQGGDGVLEPVNRINTRLYLFEAWHRALDDEKASAMVREARALFESLGVDEMEDEVRLLEGRERAGAGEWEEAARAFAASADVAERLSHHRVHRTARAHRRRAEARAGARLSPPPEERADDPPPVRLLLRYLEADAAATRSPSAGTARELEAVATAAVDETSDRWLERAALDRAATTWRAAGEHERARAALDRAGAAARSLADDLPDELRAAFLAHPRNSPRAEARPD